jgi:hypothetical protein
MPYELKRDGDKYYVVDDTGKKYSDDPLPRKSAIAQMRALYAAESKKEISEKPSVLSSILKWGQKAKRGLPKEDYAGKNESFPIDIPKDVADAARSIGRAGEDNYSTDELKKRIIAIAKRKGSKFEDQLPRAWQETDDKKELDASIFIEREKSGKYRWTLLSSNAFMDKDKEIVSTKALENDVDESDASGLYGPIRWWHVKNLDLGECDFRMVWSRTLIESGTFFDDAVAEAVKEASDILRVSIGFFHPKTEPVDGIFENIRTYERSILPAGREANALTKVAVKETSDMAKANLKEKLTGFAGLVGKDKAVEIIASVEGLEKEADDLALNWKEADEVTDEVVTEIVTDEVVDTEVKEVDEVTEVIGNLSLDKFSKMVAEIIAKELEPVRNAMTASKKEADDKVTEVTSLKENLAGYETKLAQQEKSHAEIVSGLNSEMTKLKERLNALEGEVPSAAKGYVASEANDNLIEKERAEKNMPHADPLLETLSLFTGQKP